MTFKEILKQRLHHDLGFDFYRRAGVRRTMEIYAKSSGILCGTVLVPDLVEICESEFFLRPLKSEEQVRISANKKEGEEFQEGDVLLTLEGDLEVLLKVERHVCDILGRLSGVATNTWEKVKKIEGTSVYLLDTRKDNPLDRQMDKHAITVGRARMHRAGFYDGTLIKDTDIDLYRGVKAAIDVRIEETKFLTKIEIEVETMERLEEVLADGRADVILLDNMNPAKLRQAVERVKKEKKPYVIEASGIGGNDLREVAETGVHFISLSSLVEGAKKRDISKRVVKL